MCEHTKTFSLSGKASDRHNWIWPDGSEGDGYATNISGLCSGDYIDLEVCINCKAVLNLASLEEFEEAKI